MRLPNLYMLSCQLLCIPDTSAPSERVWSIAARILVKSRTRLNSETVAALLFMKENGNILNKHHNTITGRDQTFLTLYEELSEHNQQEIMQELADENED